MDEGDKELVKLRDCKDVQVDPSRSNLFSVRGANSHQFPTCGIGGGSAEPEVAHRNL